jgi:hypothetical protein
LWPTKTKKGQLALDSLGSDPQQRGPTNHGQRGQSALIGPSDQSDKSAPSPQQRSKRLPYHAESTSAYPKTRRK